MKTAPVASQIATSIAKYTPDIAAEIQACRGTLQRMVPRGYELVYDNYNALVFAYAPSEKTSEAQVSIAAYPRWVTLFFLHGVSLSDPHKLLEGPGCQVRGIRLASHVDLEKPEVAALIAQAIESQQAMFRTAPPVTTVLKSISAKQRPRRPGQTAPAKAKPPPSSAAAQ